MEITYFYTTKLLKLWYEMNKVTYTEEKAILWKDNKANM